MNSYELGVPQRNGCASPLMEAVERRQTEYGETEWFPLGKGIRQSVFFLPVYLIWTQNWYTLWKTELDSEEGEVKIRRNTSYLRYEDDVLNWQCSEMTSNESEAESVKAGLQLNTKKTKPWPQKKYTTLTQTTKTFKLLMILLTLAQSSIQMETAAKKCQPFQRRLKLKRAAMGELGRDH